MSLFRDEYPTVSIINFDPTSPATSVGSGGAAVTNAQPGAMWFDIGTQTIQTLTAGAKAGPALIMPANVTPVTATNPTVATNLMAFTFPVSNYTNAAGTANNVLNNVGKTIDYWAAGSYTTAAGTTATFALLLGGVTILTWTSTALTTTVTKTWNIEAVATVVSTGSTGTVEAHGLLNIELGAGAAGSVAESSFNDAVVAVSSAINFTGSLVLQLQCTIGTGNAGTSITQRQQIIEVEN